MININLKSRILVMGLAAAMLTGCSSVNSSFNNAEEIYGVDETPDGIHESDYITEISEDHKYKEYADAIGLLDSEHYHVLHFGENDDCLSISITGLDGDNANEGMKDVVSLVEAHNKFVEENPDYFSPQTYIWIQLVEPSQYSFMSLFSGYGPGVPDVDIVNDLPYDHKIKIMRYDASMGYPDYLDADVSLDIPVIIMYYGNLNETDFQDLERLLDICNVDAIDAYYYGNQIFDYEQFAQIVSEKAPDTEIYKTDSVTTEKISTD